jgi:hypothetical protein
MKFVFDSVVSASALKNVVTAMPVTVTHQTRGHIHGYNLSFISSPCLALKVSPTWGCQAGTSNYAARGELPNLGPGSVLLHPTRPPPPVLLPPRRASPCGLALPPANISRPGEVGAMTLSARCEPQVPARNTCTVVRARRAKPGANAPPSPSEAQGAAGRITGGGGWAV